MRRQVTSIAVGLAAPLQQNTDDGITVYYLRGASRRPLTCARLSPSLPGDKGRWTRIKPG